jgi:uncharacterized membrane protein YdbT with pleckstrin-like domain
MATSYQSHPSMIRAHPIRFLVALLLIGFFGLGIIILLFWYLRCRAVLLTIDQDELRLTEGLFSKSVTELRLKNIRSVKIQQSFGQRLFGAGDVEIFTAGDAAEIIVKDIPHPEALKASLKVEG